MPLNALGYAAQSATADLAPFTFERRDPRPDDVVIDILYGGVCHSDLHTARNDWGWTTYPIVPGHEIIGRVRAVGPQSVSQFTREYGRYFGNAPTKDIALLLQKAAMDRASVEN